MKTNPETDANNQSDPGYKTNVSDPAKAGEVSDNSDPNGGSSWIGSSVVITILAIFLTTLV